VHGVFNNQIPGEFDILVPRRPGLFRFGPHGRTVTLGLDHEGLAQNMLLMNLADYLAQSGHVPQLLPDLQVDLRPAGGAFR